MSTGEPCSVVNQNCTDPAGYMGPRGAVTDADYDAEFECYACGEPVCGSCSDKVDGERRCDYCTEEIEGEPEVDPVYERPPHADAGLKVMARKCKTCVFGVNSPVGRARLADLEHSWRSGDTHQVCHYSEVGDDEGDEGEEERETHESGAAVCAGFFDERFLTEGIGQLLRISAGLGGICYVEPREFYDDAAEWEPLPEGARE